jgi:hypothetical protein
MTSEDERIIKELSKKYGMSFSDVSDTINGVWWAIKKSMEGPNYDAICLRYFGTWVATRRRIQHLEEALARRGGITRSMINKQKRHDRLLLKAREQEQGNNN